MVIDGETLRARVRAAEIQGRLEDMVSHCHLNHHHSHYHHHHHHHSHHHHHCGEYTQVWCQKHGGVKDFLDGSNVHQMEFAPEVV